MGCIYYDDCSYCTHCLLSEGNGDEFEGYFDEVNS